MHNSTLFIFVRVDAGASLPGAADSRRRGGAGPFGLRLRQYPLWHGADDVLIQRRPARGRLRDRAGSTPESGRGLLDHCAIDWLRIDGNTAIHERGRGPLQ